MRSHTRSPGWPGQDYGSDRAIRRELAPALSSV